jgi:prevent-host-death family protein
MSASLKPDKLMIRNVSVSDAKSHLSELVGRLMYAGDHVVIERHGKAVAAMIPIEDYVEFEKARREKQSGSSDRRQEVLAGL